MKSKSTSHQQLQFFLTAITQIYQNNLGGLHPLVHHKGSTIDPTGALRQAPVCHPIVVAPYAFSCVHWTNTGGK